MTRLAPDIWTPARRILRPKVADLFGLYTSQHSLAVEMREQIGRIDPETGEDLGIFFDSGWIPNALTNEGQALFLNVVFRETSNVGKYLALLNMVGGGAPTAVTTMGTMTESATPGTNGYDRQQILAGDWTTPALDSGNEQLQSPQKQFGPFTGPVPVSHVFLVSTATGTSGVGILHVPTSYYVSNASARTFASGEYYLVTLRDKQI